MGVDIGENEVLFERSIGTSAITVSWRNPEGEATVVSAPTVAGDKPIWTDDVFNLSDLIFYLSGTKAPKVRRNKRDPDAPLIRLSFRDLMWYCYLEQRRLDSSFFRLEDDIRGPKSRDVMRFIFGYYSDRLGELEQRLDRAKEDRIGKVEAAKQIREFLTEFGFASEADFGLETSRVLAELRDAKARYAELRENSSAKTHFADDLRNKLREMSEQLGTEEQVSADLEDKITQQTALRLELISAKFKLTRAETATAVLGQIVFAACPSCGTDLTRRPRDAGECYLCGSVPGEQNPELTGALASDLDSRIAEIEDSLTGHKNARRRQTRRVQRLSSEKASLDELLNDELRAYDSAFLSNSRELERRIAALQERIRNFQELSKLPQKLTNLEREASELVVVERALRVEIKTERGRLNTADARVRELESVFLDALLTVGFPGVESNDTVQINRTTWIPIISSGRDPEVQYSYYELGSGGKSTLFNVCYALAVHQIAEKEALPLPPLLIIDSPTKNIAADVNPEIVTALFQYIYRMSVGPLSKTQFVLIDNDFIPPDPSTNTDLLVREMKPPLIPYYHGA